MHDEPVVTVNVTLSGDLLGRKTRRPVIVWS